MSIVSTARPHLGESWEITRQSLRAARRTVAIWSAAFAGLIAVYAVIWPSVRGNTSWRNLFDTLPQTYRALFTASGTIDLSTAGGYLGVELMGLMGPALIAIYAVTAGAAAIAVDEDSGGLEVTLSAPVSRAELFAGRFAALAGGITAVVVATGATLWIFSRILGMGLGLGGIAAAAAALGIFGLFAGTVAIAVGAATGSPALARGVAALAVVASYLINALAQITDALRAAQPISPYYLLLGNEPLAHGLRPIGVVAVLAAVAAIAMAGALLFRRRDLN